MNQNYKISNDYIIIFTGDIVDRGPYGVEILYLLNLLVRCNEVGKIRIIKGNHETPDTYFKYGFNDEIKNQLNQKNITIITKLIHSLPLALFIKNKSKLKWYMFCHGGLAYPMYKPTIDNSEIKQFLNNDTKKHTTSANNYIGFLWGDFSKEIYNDDLESINDRCIHNTGRTNDPLLGIEICPSSFIQNVLDNNNIISIISGHQDKTTFGFLYRNNRDCDGDVNIQDNINDIYFQDNKQLCSRNNNHKGNYRYDMNDILCFVLSSAVIPKFRTIHHKNINYTISFGILNLLEDTSEIILIETDFISP